MGSATPATRIPNVVALAVRIAGACLLASVVYDSVSPNTAIGESIGRIVPACFWIGVPCFLLPWILERLKLRGGSKNASAEGVPSECPDGSHPSPAQFTRR
jgi:hypothetical protein